MVQVLLGRMVIHDTIRIVDFSRVHEEAQCREAYCDPPMNTCRLRIVDHN